MIDIGEYILNVDQIVLIRKTSGGELAVTTTAIHDGQMRMVHVKAADAERFRAALRPLMLGQVTPAPDES